jgi:ubiquinone/menaquinone biosynthesis C-methylase UbiE
MDFFKEETKNALRAKEYAQWIAFAPMVFQAARVLKETGVLAAVEASKNEGLALEEIVQKTNLSHYGTRVLAEAGLGIGLLLRNNDKYTLSKTGYFILLDELTRVNMNFTHDICYEGLFDLDASIKNGKPEGLRVFGGWNTIYEGLSQLPPVAKKSWFEFDHFYSDNAFDQALEHVFKDKPKRMLDIGGNTGKWSVKCVKHDPEVHMTIVDLPGQTAMARQNIDQLGLSARIDFYETNVLEPKQQFLPNGSSPAASYDAVWMSQFLDCFSDEEIVSILSRCATAIKDNGYIYVLETFWDRQRFEASAFSLQMTSLYFTTMANGNSQMYESKVFLKLVERAGLKVVEQFDNLGISHTLLKCKKIG